MNAETLPGLLSEAAAAFDDRPAIRCEGRELTYTQLDAAATAVAAALAEGGVQPGDRVVVHLPKSVEAVAALYGTGRAGAAYVPVDPRAPAARAAQIVADAAPAAAITTPGRLARVAAAGAAIPFALLLGDSAGVAVPGGIRARPFPGAFSGAPGSVRDRAAARSSDDLAYLLYTSGSTGVPKGVALTHGNALSFVRWAFERIGAESADRFANHAPLHFDVSVLDLYVPAMAGAPVVLVPDEQAFFAADLVRFVVEEEITSWYSVPTALRMMARAAEGTDALAGLRRVLFAGEVYPVPHLRDLVRLVPRAALWNLYGPTETNVCTYYPVGELPESDRSLPIGRACENGTEVFAVNDGGREVTAGEEGELLVAGPTVMEGYWGMPDRTAEVLVADPRDPASGRRVYRTGDIVRPRGDGDFEFAGRRDDQIKSRGYRIELGDVESALASHPAVAEAAAVAIPHAEWGTAIVGWVVPSEETAPVEAELRRHVAARLPSYMVPVRTLETGSLPLTVTGKVDRKVLRERAAEAGLEPPSAER